MRRIGFSVYGKDRVNDEFAASVRDSGLSVLEIDMSAEDYPKADFYKMAEAAHK